MIPKTATRRRHTGRPAGFLPLVGGMLCLVIGLAAAEPRAPASGEPPEPPEDRLTINVQDTDIAELLKFLSLHRRINIVAGKEVSGPVSVNLYDVPFETALRAILQISGFSYYREGNIIFVTRAAAPAAAVTEPVRTTMQTLRLNYANITEAYEMIQALLSPAGRVVMGVESKTLLIEDTAEVLGKIEMLRRTLDARPRQVLIEAKILEVTLDDATTVGINWNVLVGRNALGERLGNALTQGFAASPLGGGSGFFFSVIDKDVSALLSALQERGKLNMLASPKILAVDGKEAEIIIGAKLGFRVTTTTETVTLESVKFLDVGTKLAIRPFISDDGYVLMDIRPKVSNGVIEAGLPSETTTEATTSVLVKDGTTIIIGGLLQEREEETRSQIPGLGDVPVLGALFRKHKVDKSKTEIAVFITPYIVREPSPEVAAATVFPDQPQLGAFWDADYVSALSNAL